MLNQQHFSAFVNAQRTTHNAQRTFLLITAFFFLLPCLMFSQIGRDKTSPETEKLRAKAQTAIQNQGIVFMENKGQIKDTKGKTRSEVRFVANMGNAQLFFTPQGITYALKMPSLEKTTNIEKTQAKPSGSMYRLDMNFIGANPNAEIFGEETAGQASNFYTAGQKEAIRASSFKKIVYKEVYPQIDAVFYTVENKFKYDFVVRPGGNPANIALNYAGADGVKLTKDGSVEISNPALPFTEEKPFSYQGASKNPVATSFKLDGKTLGFLVGDYDKTQTLVIDPTIEWGAYIDAQANVTGKNLTIDALGNTYIVGYTNSPIFPISASAFQPYLAGGKDAFVFKFDSMGNRLWATYYGGSLDEEVNGVAIDPVTGHICIVGYTESSNLPGATNIRCGNGDKDAFIATFDATGSLVYSFYFGSCNNEVATDITINFSGQVTICGFADYQTSIGVNPFIGNGNFQATYGGGASDAFVAEFMDYQGLSFWATYLGGSGEEEAKAITSTGLYTTAITGFTSSPNFYTFTYQNGLYNPSPMIYRAGEDIFVAGYSAGGQGDYAWCYGGDLNERGEDIICHNDQLFLTGYSFSPTFYNVPLIPGASQNADLSGMTIDAIILGIDFQRDGFATIFRYYGGLNHDAGYGITASSSCNRITITGVTQVDYTYSSFPLLNEFQTFGNLPKGTYIGDQTQDAFLVSFEGGGLLSPIWSTCFGGGGLEFGVKVGYWNDKVMAIGTTMLGNAPLPVNPTFGTFSWGSIPATYLSVFSEARSKFPTFLGGAKEDVISSVTSDAQGNIIIAGWTKSDNGTFPSDIGWLYTGDPCSAFATKFDANGNKVWTNIFGDGVFGDKATGVAVDGNNNIFVVGNTKGLGNFGSNQFPGQNAWTYNGFQPTYAGGQSDGFVIKLSGSSGSIMNFSYIGGGYDDYPTGVTVSNDGKVFVTGYAYGYYSGNTNGFPTTAGAFQPNFGGGLYDGFLVCLSNDLTSRSWGTFLGADNDDKAFGVATDGSNVAIVGSSERVYGSVNGFPTGYSGSNMVYQSNYATSTIGEKDCFISVFNAGGTRLWTTLYGGNAEDVATAVAYDHNGNLHLTGYTSGGSFPVSYGGFQPVSGYDAFYLKFSSYGPRNWATIIGGQWNEFGTGIAVDAQNQPVIAGYAQSLWFFNNNPLPIQGKFSISDYDAFIVKFSGISPSWYRYIGSVVAASDDKAYGVCVAKGMDCRERLVIGGETYSQAFPDILSNAYPSNGRGAYRDVNQSTQATLSDGFVASFTDDGTRYGKMGDDVRGEVPDSYGDAGSAVYSGMENEMSISPNPASDEIFLSLRAGVADGMAKVALYSVLGERVFTADARILGGIISARYSVDSFPTGVYSVIVEIGGKRVRASFIKN